MSQTRWNILLLSSHGFDSEAQELKRLGLEICNVKDLNEANGVLNSKLKINLIILHFSAIGSWESVLKLSIPTEIPIIYIVKAEGIAGAVLSTESMENVMVLPEGGTTWLTATIRKFYYLCCCKKDQTETEIALKESEDLLRTLINALPDIVCLKDGKGRILETNPFNLELFGLTNVDYRGKNALELAEYNNLYRDAFLTCAASDEQAWRSGNFYRGEEVIPSADSGAKIFDIIKVPTFDRNGNRKGLVVVGRDITDRRQAEAELKRFNRIINLFLEKSPIYIFFKDRDIRAILLSRNYESLLGMPLDEILGKSMDEIFPSDLAKNMIADDKRILAEGKPLEVFEELNQRYYRTLKFPIFEDGWPEYLAGFTIDITEQELAKQKLSHVVQEKEALLRELQHRVKNSLNLINSLVEIQAHSHESELVRDVMKTVSRRIFSVSELYSILYNSGNMESVPLNFYLEQLINYIRDSYSHQSRHFQITTLFEEISLPINNAISLGLILNELLVNAFKYAFKGASDGELKIELHLSDNLGVLLIQDDGPGFPENFSVDASQGFGLQLVRLLISQLGGSIFFEKNDFNTIRISFPVESQ